MDTQDETAQLKKEVARQPGNAQLRLLFGAQLAQLRDYDGALLEFTAAVALDPNLHIARFQLGLLHLTLAQPQQSVAVWQQLEQLEDGNYLKGFKRGLEALIRDDFTACKTLLGAAIRANSANAALNRDMQLILDKVEPLADDAGSAPGAEVRTDFSLYEQLRKH